MLEWESRNELHAFRLLDCDPSVIRFVAQPCEIVYVQDGEVRRHYPDVYVELREKKELWEIKSDSWVSEPKILVRTVGLREALREHGLTYRLVLDHELAKPPRLQNANVLLRYGRRAVSESERESVRLLLRHKGCLSWAEACQGAYGVKGRKVLCRLVLEGYLTFDVDFPVCPGTRFFCSGRDI